MTEINQTPEQSVTEEKGPRGFAALTPERRRKIAAMGGRAVPKYKRTFRKNRQLAKVAGRKGGQNTPADKRSFSCNRALARAAGCLGGRATLPKKRAFARNRPLAKRAGLLGLARRAAKHPAVAQSSGDQPIIADPALQPTRDDFRIEPPASSERSE